MQLSVPFIWPAMTENGLEGGNEISLKGMQVIIKIIQVYPGIRIIN
jgi:hypothetical protein